MLCNGSGSGLALGLLETVVRTGVSAPTEDTPRDFISQHSRGEAVRGRLGCGTRRLRSASQISEVGESKTHGLGFPATSGALSFRVLMDPWTDSSHTQCLRLLPRSRLAFRDPVI